jgi:hypothetical protein
MASSIRLAVYLKGFHFFGPFIGRELTNQSVSPVLLLLLGGSSELL